MTHKVFKQILTWCNEFSRDEVYQFLDGKNDNPVLLKLFNLWKAGRQRKVFDEIELMNASYDKKRADDVGGEIPPDANLARRSENKNFETLMKRRKNV